jgi:5'-3' exonuclease
MGIPHLYREIVKNNPEVIVDKLPNTCKRLFLDFNSIIHQCANTLKQKCLDVDSHIFQSITEYTEDVVAICEPSELLYIAIDGVAPIAKQHQQRKRRYLSAYTNNIIDNCKQKCGMKYVKWDSNQITPGTEFMTKLNSYMKDYYLNNKKTYKVVVSGSDEAGEGEHKAINFMKDNIVNGIDVIYGLDADLIMLALTCGLRGIYLMRESINFKMCNKEFTESSKSLCFKYVDIVSLRKSIALYLYDSENNAYMYDYVVICFMVGNDFLPNISCLKLRFNALKVICDTYKTVYEQCDRQNLILCEGETYKLNFAFFKLLIEKLSKLEDKLLSDITVEYNKVKTNSYNKDITTPVDKIMAEIDNYPLNNKMTHLIDPVKNNKWRMNHYHYLFGDHSETMIKSACLKYIEGINWNVNYYLNRNYSRVWMYPYNYAPCLTDMSKYISIMGQRSFEDYLSHTKHKSDDIVINPHTQLLLVLPPQSSNIIPSNIRPIMTDIKYGCVHYYPIKFKLSTYLKYFGWEVIPVLPDINLEHLVKVSGELS